MNDAIYYHGIRTLSSIGIGSCSHVVYEISPSGDDRGSFKHLLALLQGCILEDAVALLKASLKEYSGPEDKDCLWFRIGLSNLDSEFLAINSLASSLVDTIV